MHEPIDTLSDGTQPGVLVTPAWLSQRLDDANLRILDVRQPDHYAYGHIPGAVNAPLQAITCTLDGVEGMLLPPDAFAQRMARFGIDQHTTVVVYDDTWGMAAARLFWALEYYDHAFVAVLNGGWDAWRAQGLPVDARIPRVATTTFTAVPEVERLATYAWLSKQLDRRPECAPDLVLVDTRSPAEYERGHLPGAVNWDWMNATEPGSWDAMREADDLHAELHDLGVTPDKEVVTYCRSGVRAAHTYLVLRALGYPRVRNYDGSWLEWELRAAGGDTVST